MRLEEQEELLVAAERKANDDSRCIARMIALMKIKLSLTIAGVLTVTEEAAQVGETDSSTETE